MESQQETFRETAPKEENYKKKGKDQLLEWLVQRGFWYPGEQRKGINGILEPQNDTMKGRNRQH